MSTLEKALTYIRELDLDYIVQKMCAPTYTLPRWVQSEAEHCCKLYKNFLILHRKYLNETLVPTREIDEFWHNHVLFTRNYTRDCLNIFGYYLHHEPADPTEDPAKLVKEFKKTKRLYIKEFNEPLTVLERV